MTREQWMLPAEERGSFKRIPGGDQSQSIGSDSFPIRTGSKVELQGSGRTLHQVQPDQPSQQQSEVTSGPLTVSKFPTIRRRGSLLGSLKAHYRKLRTLKGTVRALINLRRTPLALVNAAKTSAPLVSSLSDEQRSAVLEVPRISDAAASSVQSQVHKLVAEGHVVTEIDPTSSLGITYRQQGNLDHYTEDNLAKRVRLQQHPHMIALTQRLWNCALRNGEQKLKFADYETYMLCLHRLILPEFNIAASKELIMDDWKRDSGEQDHLDYAFFHLSMFELVDLWTDTVDPEDYISLLYCITHCLTYLLNKRHKLKSLEDISTVDILKESKGVTLEDIKQDLQREINSDAFAYYRDQVKLAAEANAERRVSRPSSPRRESHTQQGSNQTPSRSRRKSHIQQDSDQIPPRSRSRSRDRKHSPSSNGERDGNATKDLESTSQHRRSRSGSGAFGQDAPKRKFSVQARTNALNLTADTFVVAAGSDGNHAGSSTQNYPTELLPVSPRRETALQRVQSPNVFARGGGVILSIGMMDGMTISKTSTDGKPAVAVSTASMSAFPRRRSRSASNSSQHRREQITQTVSGKVDSTWEASLSAGLQVNHIEAAGSALRTGTAQDPNATGYVFIPGATGSGKPFTVRAAAVAEAAANMATSAAPVQTLLLQRTPHQLQQRTSQSNPDGIASSVPGGATKNIPPNIFINNSSLTAPLVTIVSSKASTQHEATSSINKIQLQFQESPDPYTARLQTPYGGLLGTSISSPRSSNASTAQAAGIFISTHQRPVKPAISPRPTFLQSPGSILSSEHQTPTSPRKLQNLQQEESLSLVATGPGSNSATLMPLTISGRLVAPNSNVETPNAVQRQSSKFQSPGLLGDILASPFESPVALDGMSAVSQTKDDLKALLSPRYIVANPVVSHHPAQISSSLKQSSVRPQGSTRGFVKNSPRIRHQPSSLATGSTSSHIQQQRHQRHPSELHGLAIAPGKLG